MLAYAAGSTAVRCAAPPDGDEAAYSRGVETPAAAATPAVETRGERESRGRDLRARTGVVIENPPTVTANGTRRSNIAVGARITSETRQARQRRQVLTAATKCTR